MDPGTVLNRGRDAFRSGQYQQALDDLIWFHENALLHDRAYYGVRLSFALGYWRELADVYPPAMEALQTMQSRTVTTLRAGAGNRDLFNDFVSINRELGKTRETYDLFRALWAAQPDLAKECRHLAVDAVVEARDFELASKCLPHPESYLLWLSERLNADLTRQGIPRATALRRREAYVHNYCADVRTALRILNGLGHKEAVRAAHEWAVALVEPKSARAMVAQQLVRI
jgi:hypothetical protein